MIKGGSQLKRARDLPQIAIDAVVLQGYGPKFRHTNLIESSRSEKK